MVQKARMAVGSAVIVILTLVALVARANGEPVRIVTFGDSLTAGYGVAPGDAYPAQLGILLKAKGYDVEITNAGVSGDTSTAGLARLDWAVPEGTDIVIVELGANDALRGIDPAITQKALDEIVSRLTGRGIKVLLAGMLAPPNMGTDYGRRFNGIFPALAKKHGVVLYPFFLDGVAGEPGLNQSDGMHPLGKGYAIIVKRLAPLVEAIIRGVAK